MADQGGHFRLYLLHISSTSMSADETAGVLHIGENFKNEGWSEFYEVYEFTSSIGPPMSHPIVYIGGRENKISTQNQW